MWIVLGTIAIVLATVAIGVLIDRKVKLLPAPGDFGTHEEHKKLAVHDAGEAPATALRLREDQVTKLRTSQRCDGCRVQLRDDEDDSVRYNDTELLVLHFTCPGCASTRRLYIVVVPNTANS